MSENFSENEVSVKDFQIKLYNYIYNYISKKRREENNKEYLLRLNAQVYQAFKDVVSAKFHVHYGFNAIVEALLKFATESLKDSPFIVQTTLFYKPEINVQQNVELNIAQKLELKLVKQDLVAVLDGLENRKGNQDFHIVRLREVLPKALRVYEKTGNEELKVLLQRAESFV